MQELFEEVLTSAFNNPMYHGPYACSGTQGAKLEPKVGYAASSSEAALRSWGVEGHTADFGASNAFVATDIPPNAAQREEIVSHSSDPHWGSLQTIPIIQLPVAVIVNLPLHCKSNNTAHTGFLVLTNKTLERIWDGQIKKWNEITNSGEVIENMNVAEPCDSNTPITRVVSRDDTGAYWDLKKYLYLIDKEKNIVGSKGWRELAEGPEVEWPGTTTQPAVEGEEAVVKLVASTPGTIGVAFYTPQVEYFFTGQPEKLGGEERERSIAMLQNNGLVGPADANYAGLRPGGHSCGSFEYTDAGTPGIPASTSALWNEVTTNTVASGYPLCGFSYVLAFSNYAQYPGTTEAEATTVNNYLRFAISTEGDTALSNAKIAPRPPGGSVLGVVISGVEKIKY